VDVRDLQLRLGRFRHIGEERAEILVFDFGLLHSGGAALGVPGVGNGQLARAMNSESG